VTCQPLIFGFDALSEPNGWVARCACGWRSASEPTKGAAMQVLRWHLDESPRQKAHRLGLVVVRIRGKKVSHVMQWLGDRSLCGVSITRLHDDKFSEPTCKNCLKEMATLADTTV
jgi:hypothetical protein